MAGIEIGGTGIVDNRDSAFPSTVELADGRILCAFSVGGGADVDGGTELAVSEDGGRVWSPAGVLMPPTREPRTANCLRLSRDPGTGRLYAYGPRWQLRSGATFGEKPCEAVIMVSQTEGESWSSPAQIPFPGECPLEISDGAFVTQRGRLLAPAALLPAKDRLGEAVLAAVSDDSGATWPCTVEVFRDPEGRHGYFEHKFAELAPDRIIAVAWTVTLGEVEDRPNSFALSSDGGLTWTPPRSTGVMGQTMSVLPLEDDRCLVLYNRRYGRQGVVAGLVRVAEAPWTMEHEVLLYDAAAFRDRGQDAGAGLEALETFRFGFPKATRLSSGDILVTHWCHEEGHCGIRWTRLEISP